MDKYHYIFPIALLQTVHLRKGISPGLGKGDEGLEQAKEEEYSFHNKLFKSIPYSYKTSDSLIGPVQVVGVKCECIRVVGSG